jgi:secreted PhoX family phosphatase
MSRRIGRRAFLGSGAAAAGAGVVFATCGPPPPVTRGDDGPYGPLGAPDANGIQLPAGFSSRVVARGDQVVPGTTYTWHRSADGGATFAAAGGGWIYVSNSESIPGGASALRFSGQGVVTGAYNVLTGSIGNCAGGATPWGTWLSGEEYDRGRIWECDPTGATPGQARPALGVFTHEAAAVDPFGKQVYLTEDKSDGRFYRFTSSSWPSLAAGVLSVAVVAGDGSVTWQPVPDPSAASTPTRQQVAGSTAFNGGEGIVFRNPVVYFATKGDDKVWAYNANTSRMSVHYDGRAHPELALHGVDNIGLSPLDQQLVVAEDHGNMELVILANNGSSAPLLRVTGQDSSELAGQAFDPGGTRLYFSSQRGGGGKGITYEVTGPFRQPVAPAGANTASVLPAVSVAPGAALALAAVGAAWRLRTRPH